MAKKSAKTRAPRRGHRHGKRELHNLEQVVAFILEQEITQMATDQRILDAQIRLDAAVAQLTTDVAALKATVPTPADVDAQVNALDTTTGAVNALDATVKPA